MVLTNKDPFIVTWDFVFLTSYLHPTITQWKIVCWIYINSKDHNDKIFRIKSWFLALVVPIFIGTVLVLFPHNIDSEFKNSNLHGSIIAIFLHQKTVNVLLQKIPPHSHLSINDFFGHWCIDIDCVRYYLSV